MLPSQQWNLASDPESLVSSKKKKSHADPNKNFKNEPMQP